MSARTNNMSVKWKNYLNCQIKTFMVYSRSLLHINFGENHDRVEIYSGYIELMMQRKLN